MTAYLKRSKAESSVRCSSSPNFKNSSGQLQKLVSAKYSVTRRFPPHSCAAGAHEDNLTSLQLLKLSMYTQVDLGTSEVAFGHT